MAAKSSATPTDSARIHLFARHRGRGTAGQGLTTDEARRIAVNIARWHCLGGPIATWLSQAALRDGTRGGPHASARGHFATEGETLHESYRSRPLDESRPALCRDAADNPAPCALRRQQPLLRLRTLTFPLRWEFRSAASQFQTRTPHPLGCSAPHPSLLPLTTRSLCKIEQTRPLREWRILPRKPWKTLK
jgi:hypothetical protein